MNIKELIKKLLNINNMDREAERLIKKSIYLYHNGGKINKIRSIRLYNKICRNYNSYISPSANIGENLYISHPQGITIGRTAKIGNNCKIYPYVAVIAAVKGDVERSNNKERRHAIIGNNCILGYGCMIIGPVTIGDNSTIAAGAIVTKNVEANSTIINVNQLL